jgi:rhodanese-related sulfurtransferase
MVAAALSHQPESVGSLAAPNFLPQHPLLQQSRQQAQDQALAYSGNVTPGQAWELIAEKAAVLVDVRTAEERKFVGYVPGTLSIPWQTGTSMQTNPRFLRELESKVSKDTPLLLLCRSGARSIAAARAAAKAGFQHVYSVLEGFEGEPDASRQRGHVHGWRFRGLPWVQD